MRERVARFAANSDSSTTTVPTGLPDPTSNASQLPAIADTEEDEDDESSQTSSVSPQTEGGDDDATSIDSIRSQQSNSQPEVEAEPVSMPPPIHLRIPDVGIDTKIVEVGYEIVEVEGQRVREWEVASYAAGHHKTSASPGEGGNIVITGHNDWEGEVFRTLEYVEAGYEVILKTEEAEHRYIIEEIHMRREVGVSMEERLATGQFMAAMDEERVTLITCWPYGINDHRVIVVAKPAED